MNVVLPAIVANALSIADTLGVVIDGSCSFDFSKPIDNVYVVNLKKLTNKEVEVEFAIVQGALVTNIKSVFTVDKSGATLLYLSLVCNQLKGLTTRAATSEMVKAITVSVVIDNLSSGILDKKLNPLSIKVYPIPARERLYVDFESTNNDIVQLNLRSVDGRVLYSIDEQSNTGFNHFTVNSSILSRGLYILTVSKNGVVISSRKFTKN
jgi:hypothetical protein